MNAAMTGSRSLAKVRQLLCVGLLMALATPAWASEEPYVPVVLIPPFTNSARSASSTPNTDAARERLEDLLVNKKFKVVERTRIDQLLKEAAFSGKSALTDSDKAVKMGKALGANVIIYGTILDVTTDRVKYNDSKIRTEKTTVKAGVRIRVVDMASGTITFSREFNAEESYDSSTNGGKSSSDAATKVIKKAIAEAGDAKEFLAAINTRPPSADSKGGEAVAVGSKAGGVDQSKPNKASLPAPAAGTLADSKAEWLDGMAAKNRAQWSSRSESKDAKAQPMVFNADGSLTVDGASLYATEFANGRIKLTFGKISAHPVLILRSGDGEWYSASWDSETKACLISLHAKGSGPKNLVKTKHDLSPAKHEMEFAAIGKDLILSIDGKEVARTKDGTIERGKAGVGGQAKLLDVRIQAVN